MNERDQTFLRKAFELARKSRVRGNHPFGALLVDENDKILCEAENTVVTESDCTGHAETNLMRQASKQYDREFLAECSLYTSTEPCPMCCGAIYWGNIQRVVFGLSAERLYEMLGDAPEGSKLFLTSREILSKGEHLVEIVGPVLEDEARQVHEGFW
ncbi:nucleoside deaminase [candidate division KSB1 bacterium]|nr:nucleoside deaminase [candidate division KSB1 bacterium]NIR71182.1 nucleoside deaminase [candidate division KSB1 bacterium]NIS26167.1 nucleoside deaminase [candidate division KSB1 bacterium]NIT72932.1 nucleoside deaminase [candidate division KSB1 bacterium]NIU26814.1 nucleoside deaminase [candidate division KSB1 bacterium]